MANQNFTGLENLFQLKNRVLDASVNAIAILNLDGYFIYVNISLLKIFNYKYEDMIGKHASTIGGGSIERSNEILDTIRFKGYSIDEHRFKKKDGTIFIGQMSGTLVKDALEKPASILVEIVDVSERKKTEKALISSVEKYRTLFQKAPIALWEMDWSELFGELHWLKTQKRTQKNLKEYLEDNQYVVKQLLLTMKTIDLNNSMLELFHCENKEIFINNQFNFFTEESVNKFREIFISLAIGKTKFTTETYMQVNQSINEKIYVRIKIFLPRKDVDSFSRVLVSLTDISALKIQRDELSGFAHVMAHDLRNYLQAIDFHLSLLELETNNEMLGKIQRNVENIKTMLNRSLILADAGKKVEISSNVDLNKILQELAELVIPKHIQYSQDKLPIVVGDKEKIIQIFKNLLENAVKHGKPNFIKIQLSKSNKNDHVRIINDGILIKKNIAEKIFDLNQNFHNRSGLGMKIIKKLVDAHSWTILLENIELFTTFLIKIPNRS